VFDNRIVGGNWSATVENRNFRKFDESENSLIGHFEIIDRVGRFGNDTVDISNVTTARTCSFLRRLPFSFVYSLRASSTSAFPYSVEIRRRPVNSRPYSVRLRTIGRRWPARGKRRRKSRVVDRFRYGETTRPRISATGGWGRLPTLCFVVVLPFARKFGRLVADGYPARKYLTETTTRRVRRLLPIH